MKYIHDFKTEAIRRMKELQIDPLVIDGYEKNDTIYQFTVTDNLQFVAPASNEQLDYIKDLTDKCRYVYLVVKSKLSFGVITNYLTVSKYIKDWDSELNNEFVVAYCQNHDMPQYSESGFIPYQVENGFIKRSR